MKNEFILLSQSSLVIGDYAVRVSISWWKIGVVIVVITLLIYLIKRKRKTTNKS
jgi:hypothetical protein